MMLHIKKLRVSTIVGVLEWEQKKKREVIIDVSYEIDGAAARKSDRIEDTVDYRIVAEHITKKLEGTAYQLIERLADDVLSTVLSVPKVLSATIHIDKPGALPTAEASGVTVSGKN